MIGECVTLVEQVEDGKILDGENKDKTPSTENEDDPTEVAKTSDSANH